MIDDLEQVGMKLCDDVLGDEHDACINWVQEFKHGLEEWATDKPIQACQTLTMCPPEPGSESNYTIFGESFFRKFLPFNDSSGSKCDDCIATVEDFKVQVISNKVIGPVNDVINEACKFLSRGDKKKFSACREMASSHAMDAIKFIIKIDSHRICSIIGQCEFPKEIDEEVCKICQSMLNTLKLTLQKPEVDAEIKKYIEFFCEYFGGNDYKNCFGEINQAVHIAIEEFIKAKDYDVCIHYNLCG